jgi:uncharacterized protein GlcG (DUF336 family)
MRRVNAVLKFCQHLPIRDLVDGAVGVSGAPGGEKDEVCAKAGIDKAADTLK